MSATASPFGFVPISNQTGQSRPARMPNGIASGFNQNIWKYQPITINVATGLIQPVTSATQQIFGVFAGVEFAQINQRPQESTYWPAGTVIDPTADFLVYYWPAWIPGNRWEVQADGPIFQGGTPTTPPIGGVGGQYNISNFMNGNSFTGSSTCTVGSGGVVQGSQGQFAMLEFATGIASTPGDAFTNIIVTCTYPQAGLGFQPSIG